MASEVILVLGSPFGGRAAFAARQLERRPGPVVVLRSPSDLSSGTVSGAGAPWDKYARDLRLVAAGPDLRLAVTKSGPRPSWVILDSLDTFATTVSRGLSGSAPSDPADLQAVLWTRLSSLIGFVRAKDDMGFLVLSHEPADELSRDDSRGAIIGRALCQLNALIAERADQVYFIAAGRVLELKHGLGGPLERPGVLEATSTESSQSSKDPGLGLVQVYTGNGKGKTTAALGLAMRASGQGLRVGVIQFMKGEGDCGEHLFLARYPAFPIIQLSDRSFWIQGDSARKTDAERTLALAKETVDSRQYDLLVLDEILTALSKRLLSLEEVLALIDNKPPDLELVLTGRSAPPELVERAHLVSRIDKVKHPYDQSIGARKGIEY